MLQQFVLHVLEREATGRSRPCRLDLVRQIGDGLLEIGIVAREQQRRSVLRQSLTELAAPVMDFGEPSNRCQIFRSTLENARQLALRLVELTELDQRASKGYPCRQIARVNLEA